MEKKDITSKEGMNPKFKNGEEAVCLLNTEGGYIVNSFKACIVKLETGKARVILDDVLTLDAKLYRPDMRRAFRKDDKVLLTLDEKKSIKGTVFASKWFYIFHLHRTGELKVMFGDILEKPGTKIISSRILRPGNLKELPGQKKLFSGN